MRETVNAVQLAMHCVIQRDPEDTDVDDFGQPISNREIVYDGECHYWTDMVARGVDFVKGEIQNALPMGRLVLPTSVDVRENDQITEILGVDGDSIIAAPLRARVIVKQVNYTVAVVYERIGED